MTHTLISTGRVPTLTFEEVQGWYPDRQLNRALVETIIASEACRSAAPVGPSVWDVSDGEDFATRCLHGGVAPESVGEPHEVNGRMFRRCTYAADPKAIAKLQNAVRRNIDNQ